MEVCTRPFRGRGFRGKPAEKEHRINQRIRANEVRVIGEDGEQLGVMPPLQALIQAQEKGYDLVEISPNADPPVVKIMDYGRFLYEQNKKQHEARKHQKGHKLKEVKFRPRTDQHDWDFKKKHVIRFLEDGDKVKIVVMFRGREMAHKDIGHAKLQKLIAEVAEYGEPERRPSLEGRWLSTILSPKTKPKGGGKAKAKAAPEADGAETGKTKAEPKAESKAKAAPKTKKASVKPAAKKAAAKPAAGA